MTHTGTFDATEKQLALGALAICREQRNRLEDINAQLLEALKALDREGCLIPASISRSVVEDAKAAARAAIAAAQEE